MTPKTTALLAAINTNTLPVVVEKGLPARGLVKRAKVTKLQVTFKEGYGYRVTFSAGCRDQFFWAANAARLAGGKLSLNTGDPTQRVTLKIEGWVDPA